MLKDDYLDRIADALEKRYEVDPKLIGGGVLKPNIYRIADALDPNPVLLKDGTIKNPLARIADAIERGGSSGEGSGGSGGEGSSTLNITEGSEAPSNSFGNDYDFFTYNNKLYVKTNGWWKYVGYYDSNILPYIPDGISIPNKYFVMRNENESFRYPKTYCYYTLKETPNDGRKILILPTVDCSISNVINESLDIIGTGFHYLGIHNQSESFLYSKNNCTVDIPVDVYEHNIYVGKFSCIWLMSPGNINNVNDYTANLYPPDDVNLVDFHAIYDENNTSRYVNNNATSGILRLVDDTVIQAFHQFVLNNEV